MKDYHAEIPRYTKIGIRVTAALMLLIAAFLIKNCATSIYYGSTTPEQAIETVYNKGIEDGMRQGSGGARSTWHSDNPILKKDYQKGFRKGWDAVRQNLENNLSPDNTPKPTMPTAPATATSSNQDGR